MATDRQPSPERPLPDRLPLGAASRLLGVDPDTLRRWADEGRVPAFTTPGGHRRFERKALERLIAARRTGPDHGLGSLGSNAERLSAAYRRRYSEQHGTGPDPRTRVPASDRDSFRDLGRQLVDALVRHLDETGQARAIAERDAIDLAAHIGERLGLYGVPLADAVSMFISARRPFIAELSVVARRRGVDGARIGEMFDASTWLLDRLLLAFVAGHEVVAREAAASRRRTNTGLAARDAGREAAAAPAEPRAGLPDDESRAGSVRAEPGTGAAPSARSPRETGGPQARSESKMGSGGASSPERDRGDARMSDPDEGRASDPDDGRAPGEP
ncbi:MAG TPA: helix-turn-helix domain-containing protein [Candidatus Limnocylindrales bacterium]